MKDTPGPLPLVIRPKALENFRRNADLCFQFLRTQSRIIIFSTALVFLPAAIAKSWSLTASTVSAMSLF